MAFFKGKTSNLTSKTVEDKDRLKSYINALDIDVQNLFRLSNPYYQFGGTGSSSTVVAYSGTSYVNVPAGSNWTVTNMSIDYLVGTGATFTNLTVTVKGALSTATAITFIGTNGTFSTLTVTGTTTSGTVSDGTASLDGGLLSATTIYTTNITSTNLSSNTVIIGDGTNYASFATDGALTLIGTARVYKNEWIDVGSFRVPTVNPATQIDWGIADGWEFTDGTDDTIYAVKRLPQDMDRTDNPQLKIGWAATTTGGSVVWQAEYLYVAQSYNTTASAQTTVTVTTLVSSTFGGLTISTIPNLDLPSSADQLMMLRIKRLGADGNDDLGDDCTLLGCGLRYTADKLGVSL